MGTQRENNKPKIIVILGPTASGKSDLAVKLAKKFNGEVVSADSRQVYRGLDIGTGKITKKEMSGIPHHLLDVASPESIFDVARYKKLADKAVEKIIKKDKLPIICGGTGLYIDAITKNIDYPDIPQDWNLRKKLEKRSCESLFKELKKLDPKRAKNIDPKNKRRLIRALEIIKLSKKTVGKLKENPKYEVLYLGVKKDSEKLKKLIEIRLNKRMKQGMVKEAIKLNKKGLSFKKMNSLGLEYRYLALYLQKKIEKTEMLKELAVKINQYAKRQMTWFKRNKDINWINSQKETEKIIKKFLK